MKQREIILRAYDHNKWIHFQMGQIWTDSQFEKYKTLCLNGQIFFQFTGLLDKNGKEIYEGDIVEAWSEGQKGTFEVKWRQEGSPCWILFPAWQSQKMWNISATHYTKDKQFIDFSGEIFSVNREGYFDDGLEIIGNVFENPKLLNHGN